MTGSNYFIADHDGQRALAKSQDIVDSGPDFELSQCPYCRKFFFYKNIPRHIREVHPNRLTLPKKLKKKSKKEIILAMKKHVCPSPCNAAFIRKDHLTSHKTSRKCYFNQTIECHFCDSRFPIESALFNHLNNKKCPRQFTCKDCGSFFFRVTDIYDHYSSCNTVEL